MIFQNPRAALNPIRKVGHQIEDVLEQHSQADSSVLTDKAIEILQADGALSGTEERHPNASPPPDPIGSGSSYRSDLERARRLMPLVHEGHSDSLVEASLRFVREYPREPLLGAVQEAAHYGLYDLDRLERMILKRVTREYFLLDREPQDDD